MFRRVVKQFNQPRQPTTAHTLDCCPVRSFALLTADANNNKILRVDEDTALLFGKSAEELVGCDVHSVIRSTEPLSKEEKRDEADFFFVGTHKSGATIHLYACIHLVTEPETLVEKHLYLLCDITKLHSLFSLSSKQQLKQNKPTETFVAHLTSWGVINSVYPPVFIGRAASDMMNTSMMKYIHPNDIKILVTSLKECCGKSFGSATVRWWVGQGEMDKEEHNDGVVAEEDFSDKDEEEDEDEEEEEEKEEEYWCPNNGEDNKTEEQDEEAYILVQITTLLSPPTAASPNGEPMCIIRALQSEIRKSDASATTTEQPKPTAREIARLTIEAAIAVAAVSPFSSPFSKQSTVVLPINAVGRALAYPAQLIARLWEELARAIQLGRNYILDHAQHLFDLILNTISFISNLDIPAAIADSAHPPLPAPIRQLMTHAARTNLVRGVFGTIGRSMIGGVIGLEDAEREDVCIGVVVGLAEGGWARLGERARARE